METGYGLLFDQSLCIGCGACEQACQAEHDQEPHRAERLDQDSFTWLETRADDHHVRHLCMSCLEPTCASVCPVGALEKTDQGPVVWHGSICMGCRYCLMACPFEVPKYEWHSVNPRVRKCDMCVHRVVEGRATACASICPTGATVFGARDELLAEAGRRLQQNPERYTGRIYGEHEAGGTGVLMLLRQSPAEAGLPAAVPDHPLPDLTWAVLGKLPAFIPVWGAFLGGMYWLTDRKNQVADQRSGLVEDDHEQA